MKLSNANHKWWQVVVTIQLRDQRHSTLPDEIVACLKKCDIYRRSGPGKNTWQGPKVSAAEAAQQLGEVLLLLAGVKQARRLARVRFDFLWAYIERV